MSQPPVKLEVEEEEVKDVSVSLSVPSDTVTNNRGLTQSATDRTKYFEPQDGSVGAVFTSCTPVKTGDDEEKVMPSPDGLSCSPSTFHSSLPTASTSVIVPGTFTQKNSKEKVHDYLLYCYTKSYSLGCESNIQLF